MEGVRLAKLAPLMWLEMPVPPANSPNLHHPASKFATTAAPPAARLWKTRFTCARSQSLPSSICSLPSCAVLL